MPKKTKVVRINEDDCREISGAGELKLARLLAEIVCSNDKQNVILLIEAKPGFGKSYAAIDLAVWTAIEISKIKGGDPWYYFNMDHMAIINPDDIMRVIDLMHTLGIYIFDDFGVGYSARDWQSDGNKAMNKMLQTIRTDNNILIMTVPDSDWIDKIGRNILHFKVVMTQKLFRLGHTMGRFTVEDKQYNTQSKNILHRYLTTKTEYYNRVIFSMPPKALWKEYDRRREIQLTILKESAKKEYKESKADASKVETVRKADTLMEQVEFAIGKLDEGITKTKVHSMLKKQFGDMAYTANYIVEYARKNGMYG